MLTPPLLYLLQSAVDRLVVDPRWRVGLKEVLRQHYSSIVNIFKFYAPYGAGNAEMSISASEFRAFVRDARAVDDVFLNDHDCDIIFAAANAAAITDRAESALANAANPARLKSKSFAAGHLYILELRSFLP